jgi:hypothetical protein
MILKHNVVGWLREAEAYQPTAVHLRPGWTVIMAARAQQESTELLARLSVPGEHLV